MIGSSFNPALNLAAFPDAAQPNAPSAPPALHALYTSGGKYDGMDRSDVAKSFQSYVDGASHTPRLAIFFHGGLVDKATGSKAAAMQYVRFKTVAFPYFFIWESGIWEVLSHHLPLIFAETVFGAVVNKTLAALKGAVPSGSNGTAARVQAVGIPVEASLSAEAFALNAEANAVLESSLRDLKLSSDDIDAFVSSIASAPEVQHEVGAVAQSAVTPPLSATAATLESVPAASTRTYLSREVVASVQASYAGGTGAGVLSAGFDPLGALRAAWTLAGSAAQILGNVVNRFRNERDHGLACTIVEETLRALYVANTGSAIWEELKNETEAAFGSDSGTYGGTAVVEEVCKLVARDAGTKITLVGHSTGGIYIGNFLRHVDSALQKQGDSDFSFDVVLMAPANTLDFWAANYSKRVRGIRLFGMSDATECKDLLISSDTADSPSPSILGRVYPRSLLYLVSGICETFDGSIATGEHEFDASDMPLFGMERFFALGELFAAAYPSVVAARSKLPSSSEAISDYRFLRVLSPTPGTAPDGLRSASLKHGNFPGDADTQDSLAFCFENGLVAPHRGPLPVSAGKH